jgi:DNA-binding phage protein
MNPDVQKIFNKFSEEKTELSTEKVELALVDDAKNAIKASRNLMNIIEKDGKEYLTLYRRIQNNGDRLMSIFDVLENQERKLEQAAKDLGVKIPEISELDKV